MNRPSKLFLTQEPEISTVRVFVAEGEEYTISDWGGGIRCTVKQPDVYRTDVFLSPSRLNLAPISLGDLVEITYNNDVFSGYVESLDTYICIRYTGRKKRFRIDDCQFIKRIV